jgi:hypothetical protein
MTDDTIPLVSFPAIEGRKVTAAFDGGRLSSDGGVMLLSMADRRLGVAERLARCIPDRRDRSPIAHTIADMIRARAFAICCGYEDAGTTSTCCAAIRRSSSLRTAARQRARPVFRADPVAARKRAGTEGRDPPDLSARRPMDGLLRNAAVSRHARHRRPLRRGARPSAAFAVQRPL